MAAPKKNSFWKLRSKHGRDKIFETPDDFLKVAYKYFKLCDKNPWHHNEVVKTGKDAGKILPVPTQRPYTIEALCRFCHITHKTFLNYEKEESYKDFLQVFTHVREIIENNQFEGATVGAYNANIIARKLGLVDKQKKEHSGKIETHEIDYSKLSAETLKKLKDELSSE